MRLYYYHDPHGNFGDDLNPWLWSRLLPGFFDDDPDEMLVGIGTLLNQRLPKAPLKHVFGSGYGYGEPPAIDDRFVFHAVRGPHTARMLGIDPALAITDAAVLLRAVDLPQATGPRHRVGFIPHAQSSRWFEWSRVCEAVGFHALSARWDVDRVLAEIRSCDLVLCEAMHGAIAADTLRVPWIPVACYSYIDAFKWGDWLATLDIAYEPHRVQSLFDVERDAPLAERAKSHVKRSLRRFGIWSEAWWPPPPRATGAAEFERAAEDLRRAAAGRPHLSDERRLDGYVARYVDLVRRLPARQAAPRRAAHVPRTA